MKTPKETIRKFLGYLNNPDEQGGFWLPNIQRDFVWSEIQIERLFDSILREYPIGTLLVWKTKEEVRLRKFIDIYKSDWKGSYTYELENTRQKMLVLDGQQRLQSLFIGLKGSYNGKELALNVLSGEVVQPEDIKYKFKFLSKEDIKPPYINFKDIVFNAKREYNQISSEVKLKFTTELNDADKDKIETLISKILRIFRDDENIVYQEIDQVEYPELYTVEDVVEIFIRANSGGTPLSKSDLLFSLLTSSWKDADDKMEELLETINLNEFDFTRDFILKTCLTILDKGAQYKVEKFRDNNTKDSIINNWDKISEAIKDVRDFLCNKTFIRTDKAIPSYLVLIPLVYYRYHYKEKWSSVQKVQEYLIRTLLSASFSGNPDTLINACVTKIKEGGEFSVDEIFGVIREHGRNLEITESLLLEQGYGSKAIHLIFNLWYTFNYVPAYDGNRPQVDHIFPQSILKTIKTQNPSTGRIDMRKYKVFDRDQIANCMLLSQQENGSGGKTDILPKDWFANKPSDYLEMHLIPQDPTLWEVENYERFIEERKKLILNKFKNILIKPVTNSMNEIEVVLM